MKKYCLSILLFSFVTFNPVFVLASPVLVLENSTPVPLELNHANRTAEEKARDANRKPVETLAFFEVENDMRVVELFPGRGWYTKLLAPYLKQNGKLYISLGTQRVEDQLADLGFDNVDVVGTVEGFTKTEDEGYIYSVDKIDLGVSNVDRVLTFRNAHNLTPAARAILNKAVFDALKPGGVYGVIDHTKRHMEPFAGETWRRVDPVIIIKEALDAGFVFESFSDIHARPEDNLQHDSRHESLPNESDRFTLKFRKPE